MNNTVSKSVLIKGSLKSGKLKYKPYPTNEFIENYRSISIGSVSFISNEQIDTVFHISCNFIKAQKYDADFQVVSYEQPLQNFLVNNKKNQSKVFNLIWFPINSVSEDLIFTFQDFQGNLANNDIEVAITVFFRWKWIETVSKVLWLGTKNGLKVYILQFRCPLENAYLQLLLIKN